MIHDATAGQASTPEDVLTENETRRENLKETLRLTAHAYETAAKRSGKKGVAFLHELKAGKTEIEAARIANISDRTGRRILKSIRDTPTS